MSDKDLRSQVALVTGANTGIGRVTAEALAGRGARVLCACRSEEKARPVVQGILERGGDARFLALDLGDFDSVREAAKSVLAVDEPLHLLINNAGLAGSRGVTKQGFELAFGTNHLGHFLLTDWLLPRLRQSGEARIVNVSSKAHYAPKGIDWQALQSPTKTTTGVPEYGVSKLANVLFTKALARGRAGEGVRSYALHPGVIASDVWREVPWPIRPLLKLFMITTEEGAKTTLCCATSPDVASHDGRYYDDSREKKPSRLADDEALIDELWRRSEAWTAAWRAG
jgi:NAD(P)-dependent dehydrogenase (short-subunit alcohol dehydrogenase family)